MLGRIGQWPHIISDFAILMKVVVGCVSCRGATDVFEFSSKNVGDIAAVCISHCPKDKKKSSAKIEVYWHVQEIIVTEMELRNQ